MIFSYKKLKQLSKVDVSVEAMSQAINRIGFEVEGYKAFSNVKGIKFGHVEKVYKNPQADQLFVCEIQFFDTKRIIQTKAQNVKAGDYLMAFVPGSSSGNVVFGAKEMQGIVSEGMLVSLSELGFDTSLFPPELSEGIFTFGQVDLSLDPLDFFDLDDYLIDITILSNRSDAAAYLIMAREIAAFFNQNWEEIRFKSATKKSQFRAKNSDGILTLVESENKCIALSWQEKFLLAKTGIKIINPAIDLTNLNLLMTGMPTHVYDKASLNSDLLFPGVFSGEVEILGKKQVTLDKGYAILNAQNIPVSLAGVMGLEATGVTESTTNLIFEMGRFPIRKVRHTTKQIKLESNSSKQSSKSISLGTLELGHKHLSHYLCSFSEPINMTFVYPRLIAFDLEYINQIAGEKITNTELFAKAKKSLQILGFNFKKGEVVVPSYRYDVLHKQDIVEEFFRFYGYDKLVPQQPEQKPILEINSMINYPDLLESNGYQQVWTYSLISKMRNIFNPFGFKQDIILKTFVSKEREVIRNSLAISLAEVIENNSKRKIENISIFDIGMVNQYGGVIALASTTKNYAQMQQDLQNIYPKKLEFVRTTEDIFHPGVSAKIFVDKKLVGWIGKIHPRLKISDAYFAEILQPKKLKSKTKFTPYDVSPLKARDVTIAFDPQESTAPKIREFLAIEGVFEVKIIDSFQKDQKNNITFRIVLNDSAIKKLEKQF